MLVRVHVSTAVLLIAVLTVAGLMGGCSPASPAASGQASAAATGATSPTAATGTSAPSPSVATSSGGGGASFGEVADAATADLPGNMFWVAEKTAELVPPPQPIKPRPLHWQLRGKHVIAGSCTGADCTFTTALDLGTAIPVGKVREIAWVHSGTRWQLESEADYVSSNTGGLICAYHRVHSWDLKVTRAQLIGGRSTATDLEGTLRITITLETRISAKAMIQKLCPKYREVNDWSVKAGIDESTLPARTEPPG